MWAFLHESFQLLYYVYFKPSALQTQLNKAVPQEEGNTTFRQISLNIWNITGAQRFLLQCVLWWLLGLSFFWVLAWGAISWRGMLIIGTILLLTAWGLALIDLSLSLAFPSLAGLVWGLKPELWATFQIGLSSWLDRHTVELLATSLVLGMVVGVGRVAWATVSGHKRLAAWLAGPAMFVAGGVAGSMASVVAGSVTVGAVGIVAGIVAVGVAGVMACGVAGVVAVKDVAGIVAGAVAGIVAGVVTVGVAVVVMNTVAVGMVGVVTGVVMGIVAGVMADKNATGVVVGGIAGVVAFGMAVGMAGIVAEGVPGIIAIAVAGVVTVGVASIVAGGVPNEDTPGGMTGVMAGIVAGVVAVGMAVGAILPQVPALGFALGLGLVLSPRRSLQFGLLLATVVAAISIEPQSWSMTFLTFLSFLVGYFRLPLFPLWLSVVVVFRWRRPGTVGANLLVRRLPPFADEVVWLPLVGLDKLLVAAAEEDPTQGRKAIDHVTESFRQDWAAREAFLQLSARTMANYRAIDKISDAQEEFAWLPNEPDRSLRGVIEVRHRVEEIARQVEAALSATSEYNQLRRFHQAKTSVGYLRQSFAALKGRAARYFIPVAGHWEYLIGEEIDRLSAEKESKANIPNPYITGIPVQLDETAMFAPRPDLVRVVEDALTTAYGKPTLALYGPRRMGKTTFLLHLSRLLPDEVVPVFVDLQEAVQVPSLGGLYYKWAAAAYNAARDRRQLTLSPPKLAAFSSEPAITWGEWLDAAERALGSRKLFFTFDEFEWLVDAAEKNPTMEGAFSILRHLSQHRPRVYLLFAGVHRLEELAPGGRWHDYFINVRGLEVSYLAKEHACRLITNPTPDFPLDYDPGTVDEIVHLTRRHPMLIQLVGSLLVNWLNSPARRLQGDWLTATMDDVAHVADEALSAGRSYFANLWHDARDNGRQVLRLLVQTPDGLPLQTLQQQSGLEAASLQGVLARLVQYQLVELVGDRWRIQVELTRRAFARLVS